MTHEPITHRCGDWTVTLRLIDAIVLPWMVSVLREGEFEARARMRGLDAKHALRCAAEFVGENADDWFREFGV